MKCAEAKDVKFVQAMLERQGAAHMKCAEAKMRLREPPLHRLSVQPI